MFETLCPFCRRAIAAGLICGCLTGFADAPHTHNNAPRPPAPPQVVIVSTTTASTVSVSTGTMNWRVPWP
jgi:hypothetical protein